MTKKSILFVITKSVWGGAGKYVYDLASNMSGDFNVAVAAGGQDVLAQRLAEAQISYFEIKHFQRDINFIKEPLAGLEILRLLFRLKPDNIHTNSSKAGGTVGLAALIYKLVTRRPLKTIFTAHGWAFAEDRPQTTIFLIKLFSKITALFYDTIICVSEFDRQIALKHHIAPVGKLITIHNGIDIKNLKFLDKDEAQKKLLGKTSPLVIGTIAEWHYNKGLFYLLEALKNHWNQDNFDIVFIGSGENRDKTKLRAYVKENKIQNIYLHEFIPNAASYLKAFDIFVLPSLKEGLPYTILEAMAAKVPVIATTVGGIPEIIDNDISGFLIKPKSNEQLAAKINFVRDNPDKTAIMIQRAKEKIAQEFSLEKMLKKTKKLY